jgi:transposase-like protein
LYQCGNCRNQHSATARTFFHQTHVGLSDWFLAVYLMAISKQRMPAAQLARILGVNAETAQLMRQRLRDASASEKAFLTKLLELEP